MLTAAARGISIWIGKPTQRNCVVAVLPRCSAIIPAARQALILRPDSAGMDTEREIDQ